MMLIDKNSLPQVAMEFMNDVHAEDVDIINNLYGLILVYEKDPTQTNKEILNTKYQEWFEHTVNHFKGEEEKMLALKFPPYPMHKWEHENALQIMDHIFRSWQNSNEIKFMKNYLENELVPWLIQHIQTMDTVTAQFFKTGMSPCSTR